MYVLRIYQVNLSNWGFFLGLYNRGLQVKNEEELESTDWDDAIENFSDEEFDDLFGDGTDIAELEGW